MSSVWIEKHILSIYLPFIKKRHLALKYGPCWRPIVFLKESTKNVCEMRPSCIAEVERLGGFRPQRIIRPALVLGLWPIRLPGCIFPLATRHHPLGRASYTIIIFYRYVVLYGYNRLRCTTLRAGRLIVFVSGYIYFFLCFNGFVSIFECNYYRVFKSYTRLVIE